MLTVYLGSVSGELTTLLLFTESKRCTLSIILIHSQICIGLLLVEVYFVSTFPPVGLCRYFPVCVCGNH